VLVAPIPRLSIVTGKVLGGAAIATLQGVLFLAVWPLVGSWPGIGAMVAAVGAMFVLAAGLTALSLCMAWPLDSTAGFHAVMNLLLMPMWFLSGAVFPLDSAPLWMRVIMWGNPLTYGHSALSTILTGQGSTAPMPLAASILVMVLFTGGAILLAGKVVSRPRKDGSA
jgi:ABC-2 type transport system permease protein